MMDDLSPLQAMPPQTNNLPEAAALRNRKRFLSFQRNFGVN